MEDIGTSQVWNMRYRFWPNSDAKGSKYMIKRRGTAEEQSFCYMCIVTHLQNKSDCPCCVCYLTKSHLFPNFLLNKVLKKMSVQQIAKKMHLPLSIFVYHCSRQDCEMSINDLDNLLSLLAEKKRKMEQQEAETNMHILLDFLQCLRKQKLDELNEVQTDLQYIKEDINAVERHRMELYRTRELRARWIKITVCHFR